MSKRPTDAPADVGGDPKRPKIAGLPNRPSVPGPPANGNPPAAGLSAGGLDLAAVRAQIAARMAALGKAAPAGPIRQNGPSNSSSSPATATPAANPKDPLGLNNPAPTPSIPSDLAARIAAAKAKIAEQSSKISNPYISGSGKLPVKDEKENEAKKGGLSSAVLHPLLADLSNGSGSASGSSKPAPAAPALKGKAKYGLMAPKHASVLANAKLSGTSSPAAGPSALAGRAPGVNPYTSIASSPSPGPSTSVATDDADALAPARRVPKTLKFAQKGKFIAQAEQMRKEAKMEELRKRIAEASRKTGLEDELGSLGRYVKRQPPPDVEWWDAPLLVNKTYDDLDTGATTIEDNAGPVTLYIQHPIPIPAPADGKEQETRALFLTKKEQKKMRRQRRAAELQDKQDRQKMGLLPPDPPKIRLANMMRVLTSAAVADPTKIEARVKAEAAARQRKHEEENASRALTAEQKKQKLAEKQAKEERKGLYGAAYKIKYLVNGSHRFKIAQNAKQLKLDGVLILHPQFALVYVEGSALSLKKYKRLMTVRIDWTEEARPKIVETDGMDLEADGEDAADDDEDAENNRNTAWQPKQERPETLADNRCEEVWEGEVSDKTFSNFWYHSVDSDREAKEKLGNRQGVWDVAKRWIWEDY